MQKINNKYIKSIVHQALREDLRPSGDITTKNINNKKVLAKIITGQNCVIGGINFAKETFKILDKKIIFKSKIKDGRKIKKGKIIATLKGSAKSILRAERVALNFIGLISGVATITNKFVKKLNGKPCKICCTRKTLPNLRLIQKYAVRLGGGTNHRFNLSDEILIKDNHIAAEKNLRELLKKAIKTKKIITVEIENLKQLNQVLGLKFKRILFDNMNYKQLKKCLKICKNKYETEFSGNVNLNNIKKIASSGVDRVSIGFLTHSAKTFDTSLIL